jgi:hypothetical protein
MVFLTIFTPLTCSYGYSAEPLAVLKLADVTVLKEDSDSVSNLKISLTSRPFIPRRPSSVCLAF